MMAIKAAAGDMDKPFLRKQCKKRLSQEQLRVLETNFSFNSKLDPDLKSRLAMEIGIPPRQVAIWYQNKRAREKSHSLEASHRELQVQLEAALAHNLRLKGEVDRLRAELTRARYTYSSYNSSVVSDHQLQAAVHHSYNQSLEGELYATLVGSTGEGGSSAFVAQDGYNFFGSSSDGF